MANVESGADMRGRRRRDDGWDEGHQDTRHGRRDAWSDGSSPGSGGPGGPGGDWGGADWPAATGYQRPAAQAVFPTASYPGQGTAGQAPAGGTQGYGTQGYGDTASYGGGGQGPAGPGYGGPGYPGNGSGYPGTGTGYDAPGHGGSQYGSAQYGSTGYGSAGYGSAGYGSAGYGGQSGDPAYGAQGQAGAGYQDPGHGQRGYDTAGYNGSSGYGGGPGYGYGASAGYGSGSGYGVTANSQAPGSAYQGSAGIGAPGRGNGEFPDFAAATAQYGRPPSSQEPGLGIPEFAETDAVASANGNSGGASRPYGRLSIFTLLDDKAAEFDRLAERAAEGVRTMEPDTLVYVIHVVPKAPMQRIIYEIYRDRAAFESHERQPHIQRFAVDRAACVAATNITDLRLKYAKVTALGTAQAPQESQPSQETQSTWVPRALESGTFAYANSGAAGSGGTAGSGGAGGFGANGFGSADDASGGRDWPADPASGQYSTVGAARYPNTGRYPEAGGDRQSESGAWGQRYGGR